MNKNKEYLKAKIPFNKPYLTGKELDNIKRAYEIGQLSGNGYFTKRCQEWMEKRIGCKKCLLTHSCTGALEMAAILAGVGSGDEVIMPSFTFVSTANAFVLRGAKPVYVDIRQDTQNIDESKIEKAITKKTKAIVVVHYAGVPCEMGVINKIARNHKLVVIEDSAQALFSKYKNKYVGTLGDFSTFSFHETKNVTSGEGGALCINNKKYIERAEIIWEKGTNKKKFMQGQVDKYTWVDVGSSFLPGELTAAFLFAQLKKSNHINRTRMGLWKKYEASFQGLEHKGYLKTPVIPKDTNHNAHLYYMLLNSERQRNELINYLRKKGIVAVFHYIPLHSSKAGKKYGKCVGNMNVTNQVSKTLVRLPLYVGLKGSEQQVVINRINKFFTEVYE